MKITHRNPAANWWHVPESAQVDPAYAAEVQRCIDHGEREYRLREDHPGNQEEQAISARSSSS